MLLVTVTELWTNFGNGLETFFEYPVVQTIGTWLDTGIVGVATLIFFKYVLPKLVENVKQKEYIKALEQNIIDITEKADDAIEKVTGVNLGLEDKLSKLGEAFDIAFTDSNIGIAAKKMISSVLQSVITGTPIDVTDSMRAMQDEGKKFTKDMTKEVKEVLDETKTTALNALEQEAEAYLNTSKSEQEG